MEFRELEAFVAVAEELHFGRAARRLHISQPALSQQIQRLETDLGAPLLRRTSREVALTAAGTVFLERCRVLLGDVADAIASTQRVADGRSGRLDIGYVGSTLYGVVPQVVDRLRRTHPDIHLDLIERKTAPQLAALAAGEQDVGFVHRPAELPDGILLEDLITERIVVLVPPAHALARETGPLAWAALADVDVVLFPRELEPDTHDLLTTAARDGGIQLRIAQEARGLPTILSLVRAGVGMAFVVESVAEALDPAAAAVQELEIPPEVTTSLAWTTDGDNPAVAALLRLCLPPAA